MTDRTSIPGKQGVPSYTITAYTSKQHAYALVIPVLNENERITAQLARIRDLHPDVDVIIADGGSTDGSTNDAVLAPLGVNVLLVKTGPGKLSAQLRMAFDYCLNEGYAGVITMDGNGKDGADGITTILNALEAGYDFVQGSRFVPGGQAINTPRSRYLAIRTIHAPLTSAGARFWYTDTTNGFRGHSSTLLNDPHVNVFRDVFTAYELIAYLPVRAARLGYKVCEVPVSRAYPRSEPTPTKIHGLSSHIELMQVLVRAATGRYNPRDAG